MSSPINDNNFLECKSKSRPRHNILVHSGTSFEKHLTSILDQVQAQDVLKRYELRRIAKLVGREDNWAILEREDAESGLKKAEAKATALTAFHQELSTHWATDDSRILGHVIFSPPIVVGAGAEKYTQDVAVIRIDPSKINPSGFAGNVIDLGTKFPPDVLTAMMNPKKNSHNFEYPGDRLLSLRGTIPDEEMRNPKMNDLSGDPCIMVIKRGKTSGLTVGRANRVISYTRYYFETPGVSKEWAIFPFDRKSGSFSKNGDSGAVVVDGAGRIGGILTSGAGVSDSTDVTYATPINFILKTIRSNKDLAKAYPSLGPPQTAPD